MSERAPLQKLQRELAMKRKSIIESTYTIIGSADGEVIDVTEVKGIKPARDILASWENSARYSKVTLKPKDILLKELRGILI